MSKLAVFLLFPIVIANPAFAQDRPDTTGDDIVVTATGVEQNRAEVGQAVTIITRDLIDTRQTVTIADLLATTPGVTVTRNGGLGGFTAVRIRGAEADQTLVLLDGVRINDPSSPGGGFDFGNLLSSSIERIELLRGPNSVPWGSRAIGGVINLITDRPSNDLAVRANAEGGYAGTFFGSAGVSGGSGPVSASLTGGYLATDGISAAAVGRERDGYRQYGANARVKVALSDQIAIDLRGYYADSRTNIDGFPPPSFRLADTPEFSTAEELYGYAGLTGNFLGGRFRNRLGFTIADINRDNFDRPGDATPAFLARGRSERYEYQGDLTLSNAVRAVFGAEHEESRFTDGFTVASTGITSGFAQAIVKPVAPLTLTGGIRYDSHRTFGDKVTFGADAALVLPTGTTLRASYGEGFKAPTLFQLFSDFGTPTLLPEEARSFDVGAEQSLLRGRARVGVTYFNRHTRNQIDFDLGTFTYANIARTRADGAEIELALKPVDAFTVTANYTLINATNRSVGSNFGKDLARRPHQTVSVSADYRFPFGLSVGGTVLHVGDSFDNASNTRRLDGYVVAGLRAEAPLAGRISVYGRIDNLFDERYETVAGYGTYGRAAYGGIRVRLD